MSGGFLRLQQHPAQCPALSTTNSKNRLKLNLRNGKKILTDGVSLSRQSNWSEPTLVHLSLTELGYEGQKLESVAQHTSKTSVKSPREFRRHP